MNKKTTSSLVFYDFIRWPIHFYSAAGIKMFQWDENDKMTKLEMFLLIVTTSNIIWCFVCKAAYVFFDTFTSTAHASQWFLYLVFATNSFFKTFSAILGRKRMYLILKEMEKIFPQTRKERQEFQLEDCYIHIRGHAKLMASLHCCIGLMFIVFPIVQSTVEYYNSTEENPTFKARTPYVLTYPFDSTKGFGYIFSYSGQFLAGVTIACYFLGYDMFLLCTVYLVIMQYAYLCRRIENFKSQGYEEDFKELRVILERHNILNEAASKVNDCFSLSILLNYMISIIIIVLIGIQIITGSDALEFVKFVGFLSSASTQVYYMSKFATDLLEVSSQISEAFMAQEWYNADVRYQRMIVLAIARAQKPSHLTAFKFFVISMESYGNLMTTSYQFFTLFKAQMEDKL